MEWLQAELQRRGITATVYADRAEERRGDVCTFIGIPVLTEDQVKMFTHESSS